MPFLPHSLWSADSGGLYAPGFNPRNVRNVTNLRCARLRLVEDKHLDYIEKKRWPMAKSAVFIVVRWAAC